MRVKKFQARDMAEAMRMVKAELGPNAIILHSRDLRRGFLGWFTRGGVEITAGVDLKQPAPTNSLASDVSAKPRSSLNPKIPRGGRLDVKVSDSPIAPWEELPSLHGKDKEDNPLLAFPSPKEENPLLASPGKKEENPLLALSRKIVEESANGKNALQPTKPPDPPKTEENQKKLEERLINLENRLIRLTGLIENLAPSLASGEIPAIPSRTRELYNHLLEQDVDERLALSIATQIADITEDQDDVWTVLKSHLVSRIPVFPPIELNMQGGKPKVVMLVGPTGVGKTTTLAKISAQYRYNPDTRMRPKIVFITADLYRLAAVEQLQKYTEILGVDLEVTYSPDEVRQALHKHKDAHLVLFDTAGTCQRNLPQMSTLNSIVDACHPDEVHLVISATTKYSDMVDIVDHFMDIQPNRFLFTKIDESTTYGPILNTVMKYKIPISYLTTGQNVPEDIERARPERIAKLLLSKPSVNRTIEEVVPPVPLENVEQRNLEEEHPLKFQSKPTQSIEIPPDSKRAVDPAKREQCNETTNS